MQAHEQPGRPFEFIAVDLLAMPMSRAGNQYAMVVVDHFSRYAIVAPIPNKEAATVLRVLMERVVLVYGRPGALLSDQGTEFKNRAMKALCEHLQTRKVFTSPYRPQSDGLVERFNRTLLKLITAYVSAVQQEWDEVLPYVLYAYNTAFSRVVGTSPFSVVFGVDPPPGALHDVVDASGQLRAAANPTRWREQVKAFLEEEFIQKQRRDADERKVKERDAVNGTRGTAQTFKPGTLVLLASHAKMMRDAKQKLAKRRRGLFVVTAQTGPVNVRVRKVGDAEGRLTTVHVDMVQPLYGSRKSHLVTKDLVFPRESPTPDEGDEGENSKGEDVEEYLVEEVRGVRVSRGGIELLVRWKGYGPEDDAWVREADVDCAKLVEEFVAAKGDELTRVL